jgi:hypothetical protein
LGKLIAGGDSFIYGSELADCIDDQGHEQISQLTYPALIAKELNLDYVCAARPGYSNRAICRTVMNTCEQHKDDIKLAIVSWSFPGRYEFRFNNSWEQISAWTTLETVDKIEQSFNTDNPIVLNHHAVELDRAGKIGTRDFAKIYYNYVGSNAIAEAYDTLSSIAMLQQYFLRNDIPYVFSAVDQFKFNIDDESIVTLKNQLISEDWIWFDNKGFYTWAKDMRFPFATTHPLEEAHLEAAHLVYEHLRYIGRLP